MYCLSEPYGLCMNTSKKLTTIIKTAIIIAAFSLMNSLAFSATVHAADSMSPMNSCTSTCLNQQTGVAVGIEKTKLEELNEDKDPAGQHTVTYSARFQWPSSPRKIIGQNIALLATHIPPDIVRLNANFRF